MNRIHDIFILNIGSSAVTVLVRGTLQTKGSVYIEHIYRDLRDNSLILTEDKSFNLRLHQ